MIQMPDGSVTDMRSLQIADLADKRKREREIARRAPSPIIAAEATEHTEKYGRMMRKIRRKQARAGLQFVSRRNTS